MNPEPLDLEEGRRLLDALNLRAPFTVDNWKGWLRANGAALLAEAARSRELAEALRASDEDFDLILRVTVNSRRAPNAFDTIAAAAREGRARARALLPREGV